MDITKAERETGLVDLSETPDDQKVVLKILPGFTFRHPNGTKLKRDFENKETRETPVVMYDSAGGAIRVPKNSPFLMVPAKAVKGQEHKFARPTSGEVADLKNKGMKNLTPPASWGPMVSVGV